jgi:hypothetical protein
VGWGLLEVYTRGEQYLRVKEVGLTYSLTSYFGNELVDVDFIK